MTKTEIHIAAEQSELIRFQEYGVGIFNAAPTKSALKKAIKNGFVTVNGELATTGLYIKGGEEIKLKFPVLKNQKKQLIFPLKVLFEDEYLAAIHKPAGILVSGNGFYTVANALEQNLEKSSANDVTIPQPVHRLDYATTGVLLVGKTNGSIRALNRLFENKRISKAYYAITIGSMALSGSIESKVDGKAAKSDFKVIETVASERFKWLNLVKLEPKTGRRHQLRKHLSSIGNPILGDKEYGIQELILNGKGMYLHAFSVEFNHPETQEELKIVSEFPKKFVKIFGSLEG
ncbi:MAG: RluA family pseudouridine synthase [Bacteroidia bacterium]